MSHPRNSSSRKRMLYPRLTYGADKRYLRRKSLIKIYRRENRGERVSKGDVNEPGPNLLPLPPRPFLLFVRETYEGSERDDNAKARRSWTRLIDPSSISSIFFVQLLNRGRVFFFFFILFKSFHTIWNDASLKDRF